MLGAARSFARSPVEAGFLAWFRLHPGSLIRHYAHKARGSGLTEGRLVLSFDCDTARDAKVAVELHETLRDLGARPVYAVPGELLRRGADSYKRIAASGAEFLNHGHAEHTILGSDGRLTAESLFYDRMDLDQIRRDIELGDEDLRSVLGIAPRGFRTPHFGTFQRPGQLKRLHGLLAELGYEYSSSTVPLWGLRYGPAFRRFGLIEFPVTGTGSAPLEILDSWSYFASPDRTSGRGDYLEEALSSARLHLAEGAGVLSFYADPAHVHDSPEFLEAVTRLLQVAPSVSYSELLAELANR